MTAPFVHPSAEVSAEAVLAPDVKVWNWTKVREGARLGAGTSIGQCCFVDVDVPVGAGCRIQNGVSLYRGVSLGNRVFVGPNATFTNDLTPRAGGAAWEVVPTVVEDGASIGANATIVCGVTIGTGALIGAGTVVTADVPARALVVGVPGRVVGSVDEAGRRLPDVPADQAP